MDSSLPVSEIEISDPQFESDAGNLWITTDTEIYLFGEDSGVGIDYISFRVWYGGVWSDWEPFYFYDESFTLTAEGKYHIEYYGIDLLENREETNRFTLHVDSSLPVSEIEIGDPQYEDDDGKIWISSQTKLSFFAEDSGVGIDYISYRIWYDGAWSEWTEFYLGDEGFTLEYGGKHRINYYAIDLLGNEEENKNILTLYVGE